MHTSETTTRTSPASIEHTSETTEYNTLNPVHSTVKTASERDNGENDEKVAEAYINNVLWKVLIMLFRFVTINVVVYKVK